MKKRFIAGAVCPRCSAMDRIVMYSNDDGTFQECIDCGFRDRQPTEEELEMAQATELKTRVTPPRQKPRPKTEAQPLHFYPNKPGTRH